MARPRAQYLFNEFPTQDTSALSQLNFRVDRLEFPAGVVDLHLPVDAALGAVDVG